ncbi:hypothetical protein RIF29_38234 [Crotalaria pallida]|uniref:Uncharacterized protein n=1 Tax=Crotalaria pallida TaxID=3830 RepID=A0AAN9HS62_CROPI
MEKRKPTREEVEDIDERLKLKKALNDGIIPEENRERALELVKDLGSIEAQVDVVKATNGDSGADIGVAVVVQGANIASSSGLGSVISASGSGHRAKFGELSSHGALFGASSDAVLSEHDKGEWTPVRTRYKVQARNDQNKANWNQYQSVNLMAQCIKNLCNLRKPLRELNKNSFADIDKKEADIREQLDQVQALLVQDPMDDALQNEEKSLQAQSSSKHKVIGHRSIWMGLMR